MLTTKKWEVLTASRFTATSASGAASRPPDPARPKRGWMALTLLSLVLLTACEPPAPAALRKGERLLRDGQAAEAIEPLRRAVALFGTNDAAAALAWNYLGLAYQQSGQSGAAAQAYQNALSRDFDLFAARYNRGLLFLELNNLPAAISELTTYTSHQPQHVEAFLHLGNAQLRARQLDAADRTHQQVLKLNATATQQAEAYNNLGLAQVYRRKPREAFQFFNYALRATTNYPPALLNQAVLAHSQLNDRRLALDRYKTYLDVVTNTPNRAAIVAQVQRLEEELRPPIINTNLVAANPTTTNLNRGTTNPRTNTIVAVPGKSPTNPPPVVAGVRPSAPPATPPTQAATSGPAPHVIAPAPVVSPPPVAAVQTNPPPVETRPAEPAPVPVEMVKLDEEPEIKVAAETPSVPPPASVVANTTPPPAPAVAATAPARSEPEAASDKPAKKSFVQKLNPLGWFGGNKEAKLEAEVKAPEPKASGKDKSTRNTRTTPLGGTPRPAVVTNSHAPRSASVRTNAPTPSAAAPAAPPRPTVKETPPPPAKPSFPRYTYQAPLAPKAGDRVAAAAALAEGVKAHATGRTTEAAAAYRRAVALSPDTFDAWFNLGVMDQEAGRLNEALGDYEYALAIKPGDSKARYNLALALARAGYATDAAMEFEKVLAADPGSADAHLSLAALCAETLGDKARAREHYRKALELAPRHPQAAEIRRWLAANR